MQQHPVRTRFPVSDATSLFAFHCLSLVAKQRKGRIPQNTVQLRYLAAGTEFARKLWEGQTFIACVLMMSPCSLDRSTTFVKLAKWEANYGNDIFWGPLPKCPLGYAHGGGIATDTTQWYNTSTAFNMKTHYF